MDGSIAWLMFWSNDWVWLFWLVDWLNIVMMEWLIDGLVDRLIEIQDMDEYPDPATQMLVGLTSPVTSFVR